MDAGRSGRGGGLSTVYCSLPTAQFGLVKSRVRNEMKQYLEMSMVVTGGGGGEEKLQSVCGAIP